MLIMRRHIRFPSYHSRGLAISVILLAVVLLAALGVAVAIGSRTSPNNISPQKANILAGTILDQASAYNAAFNAYYTKTGCLIVWLALDTTMHAQCNLYDPDTGTITPQIPPVDAFTSSTYAHWVFKTTMVDGWDYGYPDVALKNVGFSSNSYVIVVTDLTKGVCQQINQKLLGTTNINAPSTGLLSDWRKQTVTIDLSADNAVNGIYAQCIKTTDGGYVFYNVIWAR